MINGMKQRCNLAKGAHKNMEDYYVIDAHCDLLYQLEQESGDVTLKSRPQGQVDIERLKAGKVMAQIFALYGGKPNRLLLAQASALKQIKYFTGNSKPIRN
jgi:microsomal dipeptidase-like Zn-dependent dipeptidase